jgi:glycosyltransferase involved in cell wall biosynthesis
MRVINLARFAAPYPGSFVAMLRALAAESERRGWSFEAVLDPDARERDWFPGLAEEMRLRTAAPGTERLALTGFVQSLLEESDEPTILHTHFTGFDVAAAAAARGRARTAVVWHLHTRLDPGPKVALRNAVKFRVLGRGVDKIVCVGPAIEAAARRRLAPSKRLEVLPNGIDVSRFPVADDAARADARVALDLPADRPVLLHLGWHWEMKGGPLFGAAAAALRERGVDAVAVSVGAPAEVADANGSSVTMRPPTPDVGRLYAAADVLVSASPAEGDPFSVLEAFCVGTPVVASPLASGLAGGRVAAIRVAERTPDAFADAIAATLARSPDQAASERDEARRYVEEERDVGPWAARMAEIYERTLPPA